MASIITERNIAWKLHSNLFCLKWKTENVSFKKIIEELKDIFKKIWYLYYWGKC